MPTFRKLIFPIICVILILNLSSCFFAIDPGPYSGPYNDLYALASCTIPGAPGYENVTIEIVETDSYGRTLYRFSSSSKFYHDAAKNVEVDDLRNLKAYIICQRNSDVDVYYMENICYITAKNWTDFSEDVLLSFKQRNMWNQGFDESQCSVRKIKQTPDFALPDDEELIGILGTPSAGSQFISAPVSVDANGRTLLFVREIFSTAPNEFGYSRSFILISDENGKFSQEHTTEIQDFYNHQEALEALKETVGWSMSTKSQLQGTVSVKTSPTE